MSLKGKLFPTSMWGKFSDRQKLQMFKCGIYLFGSSYWYSPDLSWNSHDFYKIEKIGYVALGNAKCSKVVHILACIEIQRMLT